VLGIFEKSLIRWLASVFLVLAVMTSLISIVAANSQEQPLAQGDTTTFTVRTTNGNILVGARVIFRAGDAERDGYTDSEGKVTFDTSSMYAVSGSYTLDFDYIYVSGNAKRGQNNIIKVSMPYVMRYTCKFTSNMFILAPYIQASNLNKVQKVLCRIGKEVIIEMPKSDWNWVINIPYGPLAVVGQKIIFTNADRSDALEAQRIKGTPENWYKQIYKGKNLHMIDLP